MWWNHAGYGPICGWWIMPVFGLICMLIFVYFLSRIFGRNGRGCDSFNQTTSRDTPGQDELLDEIKALRREVEELREKQKEGHWHNGKDDGADAGRAEKAGRSAGRRFGK